MADRKVRKRQMKSCLECNRRKKKCNREQPCNHCIDRGVMNQCVYYDYLPPSMGRRNRTARQLGDRPRSRSNRRDNESAPPSSGDSDDEAPADPVKALGYSPENQTVMLQTAMCIMNPTRSENRHSPLSAAPGNPPKRKRICLKRVMVDFLIGLFLDQVNRVYEMIHPVSFQTRYNAWWESQDRCDLEGNAALTADDEDFGLLVLRICLVSTQYLPHPKYPTTGILESTPKSTQRWLYTLADQVEKSQSPMRRPSLVTIQHRFYHICYLKNSSKIRESWFALSDAVKDAHELGLHLKDPGIPLSELEMELRRRAFWNLYAWDRFMCTYLGRWPLIPEEYCDVELPHDSLQAYFVSPYILTPFTDRLFHIKTARFMSAFMSPPSWKTDQYDPVIVADFAQRLQELIMDQLPPAYQLIGPDTSWDASEPAIVQKRQTLYLMLFGTKTLLYKGFVDPWKILSGDKKMLPPTPPTGLAASHQRTVVESTCRVIEVITELYHLSHSDDTRASERLFLLPVSLVESIATLSMYLLSVQTGERKPLRYIMEISPGTHLRSTYEIFVDAFALLRKQAQRSVIAKRGLKVLEKLHDMLHQASRDSSLLPQGGDTVIATGGFSGVPMAPDKTSQPGFSLESFLAPQAASVVFPEWMPLVGIGDRSWFFDDGPVFDGFSV